MLKAEFSFFRLYFLQLPKLIYFNKCSIALMCRITYALFYFETEKKLLDCVFYCLLQNYIHLCFLDGWKGCIWSCLKGSVEKKICCCCQDD